MIYQLYYKNDYGVDCFNSNYTKLDLAKIVEEKYLPSIQSEYSGMLYVWLNNLCKDDWIGFTSCRQYEKGFKSIVTSTNEGILDTLNYFDIITWGFLCKGHDIFGKNPKINNVFDQAEYCHQGLMGKIDHLLKNFGHYDSTSLFKNTECGIFANYWLMSIYNFYEFMAWSFPKVYWMIKNPEIYDTSTGHYNNIGYAIERLFIYWYISEKKTIKILN